MDPSVAGWLDDALPGPMPAAPTAQDRALGINVKFWAARRRAARRWPLPRVRGRDSGTLHAGRPAIVRTDVQPHRLPPHGRLRDAPRRHRDAHRAARSRAAQNMSTGWLRRQGTHAARMCASRTADARASALSLLCTSAGRHRGWSLGERRREAARAHTVIRFLRVHGHKQCHRGSLSRGRTGVVCTAPGAAPGMRQVGAERAREDVWGGAGVAGFNVGGRVCVRGGRGWS